MKLWILIFCTLFIFSSCENENPRADIPFRFVHEEINVSSIQYQALWNAGGYIILSNAGYKGILLRHEGGNVYTAFERACTYDPRESCAIVEMDESQLFLIDRCCNSTFDLSGNPSGGPASIPLVRYNTFLDQNILTISNE